MTIDNTHSTELGEIFSALSKAQGKIVFALKDKKNPFFKSSYADLTSVWEACRDPLSENGLAVIQTIEGSKDGMFLVTCLGHRSGQWMKSKLPLFISKQDPQSVGSAITYARRYALSAMVGICADEDDDGEKAMSRKATNKKSEEDIITKCVEIQHSQEDNEKKMCEFLTNYPDYDHELIRSYFNKYSTYWKKSLYESLVDYENKEKFDIDFNKWKKKEIEKSNILNDSK